MYYIVLHHKKVGSITSSIWQKSKVRLRKFNGTAKYQGTSLMAQMVKNLPAMREIWVWSLGWEDTQGEGMKPIPEFLPGESSWTEEPGGLQS